MVAATADLRARAWAAAAAVTDPELPVLTIADLGVLRDVTIGADGLIEVAITPTYSACPAMAVIAIEIAGAIARAGLPPARVRTVLAPAWTTAWMSANGRRKLADYGIAPPLAQAAAGAGALFATDPPACPRCGAATTELLTEFGSTACKSLWRCRACREPFDHFKCH